MGGVGRGVISGMAIRARAWSRGFRELELSDPVAWPQVRIVLHVAPGSI